MIGFTIEEMTATVGMVTIIVCIGIFALIVTRYIKRQAGPKKAKKVYSVLHNGERRKTY